MVSTDGHIIEIMGPSDADTMNNIVNNEDSLFYWFYRSGDVFILDRGFRDAMENLDSWVVLHTTHARNKILDTINY